MTTSPSDVLRLDRAFARAIDAARSDKSLGAGQRATAVHGLEILRADWRWGQPLYPDEPLSQLIANLQRQYDLYSYLLELWQQANHPVSDRRIDDLGERRALISDYLETLYPYEMPTVYSQAQTMDQLEALLTTPAPTTGHIDYAALKERIDIVEYIGRSVVLRKSGSRFTGRCPFHDERTASFVVYPATRSYFCFGCQTGGDVIDFAKRLHGALPAVA